MTERSLYKIDAVHIENGTVVNGCRADDIIELSQRMPLSLKEGDYVLRHSDIYNPSEWYTRVSIYDPLTDTYGSIEDPRIYYEDLDENPILAP